MTEGTLSRFRRRLASPEAALPYALLGILSGAITAVLMIVFRLALEWPLAHWLPDQSPENFEALSWHWHLLLPFGGALLLGICLHFVSPVHRFTGIPHVIAALHNGRGRLPPANLFTQFAGGLVALLSGQSGGREGPAVHIGSAASSLFGAALRLPNNSLRVMTACGTAAAIAASFNTPIAGVIFAMEVVMLEYTVAGFVPVILAAVTATTLSQAVFGAAVFLPATNVNMTSLLELPFIALLGCIGGTLSALFVLIQKRCLTWLNKPIWLRLGIAGLVTGVCALLAPQVLGIGYDSLQAALDGSYSLQLLLLLTVLKLVATAISCGMGMPIGIIGPSLLVGAFAGGALGILGAAAVPALAPDHSFYVLMGMAALMGAILNAPLAALLAVIELTHNLNIIFPAMLAVISAQLVHRELFKLQSAHQTTLLAMQQAVRTNPFTLTLLRTSAAAVMDRNIKHVSQKPDRHELQKLLEKPVRWLVITNAEGQRIIVHREHWFPVLSETQDTEADAGIDLLAVLENRRRAANFEINGTLMEALETMNQEGLDSLFVSARMQRRGPPDEGVITREALSDHYNLPIRF
ncbi:chloride channel protein [Litorivivens sp.]|uniref:chloride channel protein n=1 Tax=Litorivivens sp. TaxID=2020868 RepID=UPI0035631310